MVKIENTIRSRVYNLYQYPRTAVVYIICLLISSYLLLAGDYHVVSGFTPVTYSSENSSSECGQSDPIGLS